MPPARVPGEWTVWVSESVNVRVELRDRFGVVAEGVKMAVGAMTVRLEWDEIRSVRGQVAPIAR